WLKAFTDQVAIAIRNARFYETTQRQASELETLRQLALDLTAQLDVQAVWQTVTQGALDLVGAAGAIFVQYLPAEDVMEQAVSIGITISPSGIRFRRGEGLAGKIIESRTTIRIDDYEAWEGQMRGSFKVAVGSAIAVPVIWQGELLGAFNVCSGEPKRPFSD